MTNIPSLPSGPHTPKDDEIDLSNILINLLSSIQRNFRVLFLITILGFIAGILHYFLSTPIYDTSLIASSKVLTNVRIENLIRVLDKLVKEGNDNQLAKKLNISHSLANNIKSIEAKSIINEDDLVLGDKTKERDDNVFEITLSTDNNKQLDSLQVGILYYLQNNDFVQKRITIQKQNLETMRERVKEEVAKLDSLRFSVNKLLAKGVGNNSTMLLTDPASVNKDIMALYERELNINSELLLINDIQVIQDFTQFEKPVSPKLLSSVAASTASAITLGIILIIILELRRGLRRLKIELQQKSENEFV